MSPRDEFLLQAESEFLERLRPSYEAEGCEFVVHPSKASLPSFLGNYRPDAVARKPEHNIAIEVKSRSIRQNEPSLERIRLLFDGVPDWRLIIAYMGTPTLDLDELPVLGRPSIERRIDDVEKLVSEGHLRPAFIMAWSVLEATLNNVRPEADKRPRSANGIIQALATNGLIEPEAERSLMSLVKIRNRVVHGDLEVEPSESDISQILSAVRSALDDSELAS